ncbi:class C sortase, partial [Staphylococcus pseudintermedius]
TIGIVNIPKIKIKLPIFDTTNDLFLAKGTSLLEGTSYPTGGKSTHAVISGHRGLPSAKLFTDLPDLKKGDVFFIEINKRTLAYEIDQLKVVEPTETEDLLIEKDKDLVTLLTCTPYMINSHRLLVRGHRIPYTPKMAKNLQRAD